MKNKKSFVTIGLLAGFIVLIFLFQNCGSQVKFGKTEESSSAPAAAGNPSSPAQPLPPQTGQTQPPPAQTVYGCQSGYVCAAAASYYREDGMTPLANRQAQCFEMRNNQIKIYSYLANYQFIHVSLPYFAEGPAGGGTGITEAEIRGMNECNYANPPHAGY